MIDTGRMTRAEAEALAAKDDLRDPIQRQRRAIAKWHLYPHACPNCEEPLAEVDAVKVDGDHYECCHCGAKVRYSVPVVQTGPVPWEWALEPGQIPAKA